MMAALLTFYFMQICPPRLGPGFKCNAAISQTGFQLSPSKNGIQVRRFRFLSLANCSSRLRYLAPCRKREPVLSLAQDGRESLLLIVYKDDVILKSFFNNVQKTKYGNFVYIFCIHKLFNCFFISVYHYFVLNAKQIHQQLFLT